MIFIDPKTNQKIDGRCVFAIGVECLNDTPEDCSRCGFNPEIKAKRLEKIYKNLEKTKKSH